MYDEERQQQIGKNSTAIIVSSILRHSRDLNVLPDLIPSRRQWDCNYQMKACCSMSCKNAICDGYCGETTIQESLLYYGAYVSQGLIRRTVRFNDYNGAREVIIDTDRPKLEPDLLRTSLLLGIQGKKMVCTNYR